MKVQRFFRYLWRVNAVLILIAAGVIVFGLGMFLVAEFGERAARSRAAKEEIPVSASGENANLLLERAEMVEGTNITRTYLVRYSEGGGFSSGSGSGETRNILFVEPGQKAGRWLLPDNNHIITENFDIAERKDSEAKRVVATVALAKSSEDDSENAAGRLLLFDPSGKKIVEVADEVRRVHVTSLNAGELTVLYERDRKLVLTAFDSQSLAKKREEQIEVPLIK